MRGEKDGVGEVPNEETDFGGVGGDAGEEDVRGSEGEEGEFVGGAVC